MENKQVAHNALKEKVEEMKGNYCLQYGDCNLHSHTCIKGIEGLNPICLECKRLKEDRKYDLDNSLASHIGGCSRWNNATR